MELLLFQSLKRTLSHNQEIFVFFQFTNKSVIIGKVFRDLTVNQCDQKRTSYVFNTFQCFFIIIEISKRNYQLVVLICLNILFQLCLIVEIHRDKTGCIRNVHQKF